MFIRSVDTGSKGCVHQECGYRKGGCIGSKGCVHQECGYRK